jgi:subtilisin family serine protease
MSDGAQSADFYYNGPDERVPLFRDPRVYAVGYKPGRRSDDPRFSEPARTFLGQESQSVQFIAPYGLRVYRASVPEEGAPTEPRAAAEAGAPTAVERVSRRIQDLNTEEGIAFAAPAFRLAPDDPNVVFLNNRFLVELRPGVTREQADELNARYGAVVAEELKYTQPNVGLLIETSAGDGDAGPIEMAKRYVELGLASWAIPDLIRRRVTRSPRGGERSARRARRDDPPAAPVPSGWTFEQKQWHLATAGVTDAWRVTQGSPEITIAISDDGVDTTHPEFAGKIVAQYDFATRTADGNPKTAVDNHGTACAGVATARGEHAYGVAPGCRLMAVRAPDMMGVADEARMFEWMADNGADVISVSWGPPDGSPLPFRLPASTGAAIHYCVTWGRGGKGIPIFWAAGNGHESIVTDGYASSPKVITVAASTDQETAAFYSDFGRNVWICAPSSGRNSAGERRIFTTDRHGEVGYNAGDAHLGDPAGDYINDFGGTSSAAPLAAGVGALILSANRELTWQQVREILKDTADKIGGPYSADGHSDVFGYGRLNAGRAVLAAQRTRPAPPPAAGGTIVGPARAARGGPAPGFDVAAGPGRFYAVEVATRAELFDKAAHGAERAPDNFHASWQDGGFLSAPRYDLPAAVWDRLVRARPAVARLFYRVWTSDSDAGWVNRAASTPNAEFARAPFVAVDDLPSPAPRRAGRRTRADRVAPPEEDEMARPVIDGPETYERGDPIEPSFLVMPGRKALFAVEVAVDPDLFDQSAAGDRTAATFFSSAASGMLEAADLADGQTTYTLPRPAWMALRAAGRLFYRVIAAPSGSQDLLGGQPSWQTGDGAPPPSIEVRGLAAREPAMIHRPEEDLWRRDPEA